jgi:drug/metabolite transporter (DMT)-like permease
VVALIGRRAADSLDALRDRRAAAFMVAGAFFGPFLGVTLSLVALRYVEAAVAASLTAIYPILTLLLANRFHGEAITARLAAGAVLAVLGVMVLFAR